MDDFYLILKMEERGKSKKTSQTRDFRAFFDIIKKRLKRKMVNDKISNNLLY